MQQPVREARDLIQVARWRWKLIVVTALAVFGPVTLYVHSLPARYDAETIVSIVPRPQVSFPGADYVTLAAPRYAAYITAPSTLDRIAQSLNVPASGLKDSVDARVETGTSNITVSVQMSSPREAAIAANVLASDMVAFSSRDDILAAQIVAPAVVPTTPSSPLRRLDEAAGLLAGVLIGVVGAYVLERRRPRIRKRGDLQDLGTYSILGLLPRVPALRSSPRRALQDSSTSDAIRTLRMNFRREVGMANGGMFVVTSSTPGEGKSTVAEALSEALAAAGSRVLLVDGDLYRAGLSSRSANVAAADDRSGYGADRDGRRGGLAALLRGERTSLSVELQSHRSRGVSILPTARDREAGDLVVARFSEVMDRARDGFDFVIVDAPPILEADVGAAMAIFADGVLFVVSGGTLSEHVQEALAGLGTLKIPIVGIIGNRMPS